MRKHYSLGKGKYYFNVKSGQTNITIHRVSKDEAVDSFLRYKKNGRDVEWLGKWGGKKFSEATTPTAEKR